MTKFNGLGMNMGNLWRLSDAGVDKPRKLDGAKVRAVWQPLRRGAHAGLPGIGTGLEGKPIYHRPAGRDIYHCRH